jgi:hypothetical protein
MPVLRLLKPVEVDLAAGRVFRVSSTAVAIISVCTGVLVLACIAIGARSGILLGSGGVAPAVLAWWVVLWLGLFFVFYANDWRKASAPSAWLAVAAQDGVYLKYRSFRNVSWSGDDEQVAFVPYGAIAAASIHNRTWLTPSTRTGRTLSESVTYVELTLRDADLSELERRLADERAGKPGRSPRGLKIWRHFPVSLEPGNVVRVEWRARPGIAALAECLAAHGVTIEAPRSSKADLSRNASEAQLLELARRGEVIQLIRVLRHDDRAMTLVRAKTKAERLIAEAKEMPNR